LTLFEGETWKLCDDFIETHGIRLVPPRLFFNGLL
jgi:hypothetical protein